MDGESRTVVPTLQALGEIVGGSVGHCASQCELDHTMTPGTRIFSSPLQRLTFSVQSAVMTLMQPQKGNYLAAMSETMPGSHAVLTNLHHKMGQSPGGRQLLREKPVLHESILGTEEKLRELRRGTLGREYYEFMRVRNDFLASERTPIRYIEDPQLAYVMLRYRQTHDFYHVLTGLETSVLEEIALKWFEAAHFDAMPSATLSALVGPLRLDCEEKSLLLKYYIPWALRNASSCEFLLGVRFEDLLEEDLGDVRRRLRIQRAPQPCQL